MPSPPPTTFEEATYIAWHEAQFPGDAPLKKNLEDLCSDLKKRAPDEYLTPVGQLLTHMAQHCTAEASIATKGMMAGQYDVALPMGSKKKLYPDTTFKSTSSIVDKLWRKNSNATRTGTVVTLGNLKTHVTDLIRTLVVAPLFFMRASSRNTSNSGRKLFMTTGCD